MKIVITGAARGLGRALTEEFIRLRHTVAGCGRSPSVRALGDRYPAPHRFDVVDVACDAEVAAWATVVLRDGPPDVVINNAGVMMRVAPLWQQRGEDVERMLAVNVRGVVNVIRHFVPAMLPGRRGTVVNLSSGWGREAAPHFAPYCATKFAVEALTKSLAAELPHGMVAVPLNPGTIDTDMVREVLPGGAGMFEAPAVWARRAVGYILALDPTQTGASLTVPGAG